MSEARHRAVLTTMGSGLIVIDDQGVIDSLNPGAEGIFGYRAEELVGRKINTLMPEPHRTQHDRYIQRFMQSGKAGVIWLNGRIFTISQMVAHGWRQVDRIVL